MDMMDFKKQFLGEFIPSIHGELFDLAKEYNERCEAYDQIICTGQKYGEAIPMSSKEYGLINKHAISVKEELLIKVRDLGFTAKDFQKALITIRWTWPALHSFLVSCCQVSLTLAVKDIILTQISNHNSFYGYVSKKEKAVPLSIARKIERLYEEELTKNRIAMGEIERAHRELDVIGVKKHQKNTPQFHLSLAGRIRSIKDANK